MRLRNLKLSALIFLTVLFIANVPSQGAEIFTGNYKDYKIDSDSDGQADELAIDAELNVPKDGNAYYIRGFLMSERDYDNPKKSDYAYIFYNKVEMDLKEGKNVITLHFDGYEIFRDKMDGPYVLHGLCLGREFYSGSQQKLEDLVEIGKAYITAPYKYTEFERPDLSFRGEKGIFELRTGQTASARSRYAGGLEVRLVSVTPEYAEICASRIVGRCQDEKIRVGAESFYDRLTKASPIIALKLLEIGEQKAKFQIRYKGEGSPGRNMIVDIFYKK